MAVGGREAGESLPAPKAKGILAVFALAHFTHHLTTGLLTPLLPLIRDTFALSYTQAGLLVSSYTVSYGFSQFPIGSLGDRVSKQGLIAVGLVVVSFNSIAIGLSGNYYHLAGLLILLGILGGAYHAPAASLLSYYFPPRQRGRALGLHIMGGSASLLAAPVLAGLLVQLTGTWRWAYILLPLPAIVVGVLLFSLVRQEAPTASTKGDSGGGWAGFIGVVRAAGLLVGIAVVAHLMATAVNAFLALYMVDKHGIAPALAAMMVGLVYGAGIVSAPLGGTLSDRVGRRPVILLSVLLMGPAIYLLTIIPAGWPLMAALAFLGLVNTARAPVIETLVLDVAPAGQRATILGVYYLANQELGGLAAPAFGQLIDAFGLNQAFTAVALATCALSALLLVARNKL